ncbi:MAG: glucose/arabinose dehydrogenase [Polaribacter sp.]|jgi:glucose/arabinose dehydrogenase
MKFIPVLIMILGLSFSCKRINPPMGKKEKVEANEETSDSPLRNIKLPEGFKIEVYADDINNARSLCLSPKGTLFVGNRKKGGNVYALLDTDGDFKVDKKYTIAKGLYMPNGVAFKDGSLYVAEVNRILRFDDIEANLENPPKPVVVYDKYPDKSHHGWKYIAFGPDGKLYVPVGAPCNVCDSEKDIFNTITRMNADGTDMEIVHRGIRNTVGFNWHPETKKLWFTDNGRDWLEDNLPACELNYAPKDGMHFGFPYCHQGDLLDDKFGDGKDCADYTAPAQKLGPHVAPLGLEFYTGKMFPKEYHNQIFIAEHGSWNRSKKIGYRISLVKLDGEKATSYETFASGWLNEATDDAWGRPVDMEFLPDGSMLISDDFADAIYRVSYE